MRLTDSFAIENAGYSSSTNQFHPDHDLHFRYNTPGQNGAPEILADINLPAQSHEQFYKLSINDR